MQQHRGPRETGDSVCYDGVTYGVIAAAPTLKPSAVSEIRWRRDRRFFTGMGIAAGIAVFIGFYPTYYLKELYGTSALPPLVHVHGALFTLWIGLLVAQTSLVAIGRTDLHRRLGIGGAVLAGLMTVIGLATAIAALRRGRIDTAFFAVPMGSVVVFPLLVGAALFMRRQADAHKRLMLIATTELLSAAVGRWPVIWRSSAFVDYGVTDMFVAALLIYDIATRRRVHPATVWGGLFLIGSQVLRTVIQQMDFWLTFATWARG